MEISPLSTTPVPRCAASTDAPRCARGCGGPERRLREAQRPGVREHRSDPPGAGGGRAVGRVFQQHNTRFAIPECRRSITLQPGPFPDGRRYIPGEAGHRPFQRRAAAQGHALHAVTLPTMAATPSTRTWPPPGQRCPRPQGAHRQLVASTSTKAAIADEN